MNKLLKFEVDVNKKYELEAICNSAVYVKEVDGHLPELYYLVT